MFWNSVDENTILFIDVNLFVVFLFFFGELQMIVTCLKKGRNFSYRRNINECNVNQSNFSYQKHSFRGKKFGLFLRKDPVVCPSKRVLSTENMKLSWLLTHMNWKIQPWVHAIHDVVLIQKSLEKSEAVYLQLQVRRKQERKFWPKPEMKRRKNFWSQSFLCNSNAHRERKFVRIIESSNRKSRL